MMINKNLIILLFIVYGLAHGQQDAQYTQYMYNTITVNPAYAGSRGALNVTGVYRAQWVGLDGGPRTQTLSAHTPIGEGNKMGLGLSIINDKVEPSNETYFDLDFSYTIPASENGKLSFGLKGRAYFLNVDIENLTQVEEGDNSFNTDIENKFSPNLGVGLYYYTDRFYVGLSTPSILTTEHLEKKENRENNDSSSFLSKEKINYYLIAGHTFDFSPTVKFKPAILTKFVVGAPFQVDLSMNFLFYEKFTLGTAYRWGSAWSALAGFQVTKGLMVGFAYDKELTKLGNSQFNKGSLEVMLRFELFKEYDRALAPRFF